MWIFYTNSFYVISFHYILFYTFIHFIALPLTHTLSRFSLFILFTEHTCKDFTCVSNGFCINPDLLCDGINHCSDNSDESVQNLCQSKYTTHYSGHPTTKWLKSQNIETFQRQMWKAGYEGSLFFWFCFCWCGNMMGVIIIPEELPLNMA